MNRILAVTVSALASASERLTVSIPVLLILGLVVRTIYRLYFDPLHHIPGPKLAAITHLYEFYHDVIRGGLFIWEIEKMHREYGPIVRINPREVHIKDSQFYEEIYAPASGGRRDKDRQAVEIFSSPTAMVATVDHDTHRIRRKLLTFFFSRRSIERLEPVVHESLSKFLDSLVAAYKEDTVVDLIDRLQGLTGDVITQYAYGNSYGLQEPQNIGRGITKVVQEGTTQIHLHRFFPFFERLLRVVPKWFMAQMLPARAAIYDLLNGVREQSIEALKQRDMSAPPPKKTTMFHALTAPEVPPEERTLQRLQDEGLVLFAAGTETTATILGVALFHILNNKEVHRKLRNELDQELPTPQAGTTWRQLEKLPYLNATIHEALRCSGLTMRQQRIAPTEVVKYKNYVIPPGTPVSMISHFVNMDPDIFDDPQTFKPERWILAAEKKQNLSRFLVTFGKGNRNCIGMNLAYAELYNTLAAVVRRFDLELYQTTEENVRFVRDMLLPRSTNGPWKVRVKVIGIREE
ncbi:protein CYP58D1 [Aspergillus nidulans FGSC A4]|uniref:Cytochrome P450, putative (Eurofung) n=1 Tax=Emericella nidulans (strain FGSC A4 / ATCC 38163 / CBS 112.46 / NRRL 194 / M139) TaxID=227321 RepID=C8VQR6_EMENI|nr:protein CYP58D1 [Aspergillus nidulans FGSC A4]CBF87384.1 TPA: cytochrome P450, putative (Eurofung) [Aspergillus nidulans FGSC A4]